MDMKKIGGYLHNRYPTDMNTGTRTNLTLLNKSKDQKSNLTFFYSERYLYVFTKMNMM